MPLTKQQPKLGNLYDRKTLFLSMFCGTAEGDGEKYNLSTNLGSGTPIVRNERTGRAWTLTWQQLIDLAREGGIDQEDEKEDAGAKPSPRRRA